MPIAFTRIRIAGFKSFAEPVVVEVLPGLTGVVGPNGCGKSNIVEALRWAMGESSARSLRGGEMDDVIFAGTSHRPARSLAEVILTLEAGASGFPAPFDNQSELEVARRIERGAGSAYRVNGRDARARDVQTLFADLASGARSSAMVSQGRVGALVAARPEERRIILEEAAGIGGLHGRRHEAELKLRAADSNMQRAEDLRTQLTTQLAAVHKQAKQAARYRSLSGLVRAAEAELLCLLHARATAARAQAQSRLTQSQDAIATAATTATAAEQAAVAASATLPTRRAAESECRTALERRRMACEQIDSAQAAARAALAAATAALDRIARDRQHAAQLQHDAEQAEHALAQEAATLAATLRAHPDEQHAAAATLTQAEHAQAAADAAVQQATATAAALAARGQALAEARIQAESRAAKLDAAWQQSQRERAAVPDPDPAQVATAGADHAAAQAALAIAADALDQAEAVLLAARSTQQSTRATLNAAEPRAARLAAETRALAEILSVHQGAAAPLADTLAVPAGLEAAFGAALAEVLDLTTSQTAPRHLATLPPHQATPPLPDAALPLAGIVAPPPALARLFAQIGLIDADQGPALHAALHPGQTLVARDGALWRWDGLVQQAGAPTPAAIRLQQRNRLTLLAADHVTAQAEQDAAATANTQAETAERAALAAAAASRTARRDAEQRLDRTRHALAAAQHRQQTDAARIAALDSQIARLATDRDAAFADRAAAQSAHAALPDLPAANAALAHARATLATARTAEHAARAAADSHRRQADAAHARQRTIIAERAAWSTRAASAAARAADLAAQLTEATTAQATLRAAPAELDTAHAEAAAALHAAERTHHAAAATLAQAERNEAEATRTDRTAAAALAAAREAVLRCQSDCRDADHAWGTIAERILDRLGANPALPAPPDLSPEAEDRARRKHERLAREREEMGPVNLRAELEATEIQTRLSTIDADRDELATAIAKLRGSIGHLNREGRDRLAAVFTEVDQHFQHLFARMFGGGRANLALVGSDDPLQARLEIYAQPPGKKLAALSLLSGGEQALTALCLIFAVFRCNPAPVCVLDEVDAPLDDANIDRFCALLSDMVTQTGTRFLVVTHHHMTMARMDRLYGVTMQERGVSRLLSVDLQRAAAMTEEVVALAAE